MTGSVRGGARLALVLAVFAGTTGCAGAPDDEADPDVQREVRLRRLESGNPAIRFEAVAGLLEHPGTTARPLLELAAAPLPAPTRAWSIFLAAHHQRPFDPLPWLEDEQAEIRFRAAQGAAHAARRPEVRSALERRLEDPDPLVRVAAAGALLAGTVHRAAILVLLASLGPEYELGVADEAAYWLRLRYGPLVPFDPLRGDESRDESRLAWTRELARDPRLASCRLEAVPRPADSTARGELAAVRRALAHPKGAPTRKELTTLWTRVMRIGSDDASVRKGRVEVLLTLVKRLPTEALLHGDVARVLVSAGRLEESLPHFDIADRLEPGVPGILLAWGRALEGLGRVPEACRLYRRTSDLDPRDELPFIELGRALLTAGRPEEARAALLDAELRAVRAWHGHRRQLGHLLSVPGQPVRTLRVRERSGQ